MSKKRVVVTGLGCISPVGNSMIEAWDAAVQGVSGVTTITRFDASDQSCQIAAEVKNFKPENYFEVKDLKKVDYFSQYAVAAAAEAVKDSLLLDSKMYEPSRIGCVLGVGMGGLNILEKFHSAYLEGGPRKISPFLIPGMITNLAPGNVAIKFGLKGINFSIASACTSATHAVGESYRMIADGVVDAMVTGGSESAVTPIGIGGFCAMKALSVRNDDPARASRPFDKERDGFVMGEGSVILVLETLEKALQRNAKIYGEIIGYGTSCDAYHITSPTPKGEGAVACMKEALKSAGINPSDIGYVNAHGTSTQLNDLSETKAIKEVFGEYAKSKLLISSTKSVTGHLLGAAGAIEAAFTLLSLQQGIVPPTANLNTPDEECDLDYVPNVLRQVPSLQYALSNSFGFGGTNATLVFKKY
jgi:3-oxoacyl-[acyl-carrier-protein] synthase II